MRVFATGREYKFFSGLLLMVSAIVAAIFASWSEIAWPFAIFIVYIMLAITVGLLNSFALLVMLICLQPLIPYYPITILRGAALQDLFFLAGLPLLLLSIPLRKKQFRKVLPMVWPYVLLAAWAVLGALATQDNLSDFLVAIAKGSGRPIIIALACIIVGSAIKDFRRSEILLKAIVLTATFEAVIGIIAMIFNIEIIAGDLHLGVQNLPYPMAPGISLNRRLHGTFCTGNLTGAYFVITLPLVLAFFILAKKSKHKILWLVCGISQFIALILTFTRASLVCGIFAIFALGLILSEKGRLRTIFQILIFLVIGYSVLISVLPESLDLLVSRFVGARAEARLAPAWAGLRMIADHPLWGVGVDNSVAIMESDPRYSVTPFGETTVRPHNSFIFIGAELGLPASLILLWAVIAITKFVIVSRHRSTEINERVLSAAIMSGWMGEILHSLTNNLFHHPSLMVTQMAIIASLVPLFFPGNRLNKKEGNDETSSTRH